MVQLYLYTAFYILLLKLFDKLSSDNIYNMSCGYLFRKAAATGAVSKPEVEGKGIATVVNDGQKMVVRIVVISAVKPTCTWACGGMKVRKGGRFATSVVQEGDHYVMLLEIDQVR